MEVLIVILAIVHVLLCCQKVIMSAVTRKSCFSSGFGKHSYEEPCLRSCAAIAFYRRGKVYIILHYLPNQSDDGHHLLTLTC